MDYSTPGLPVHHHSWSPPKPMSTESVMPSNHLILCHPLLLLPSIFPSIKVLSPKELAIIIRWPKYWSFSFNIRPSNEHPGLISFRMDWLDLLAVQGTLKSILQQSVSSVAQSCPTLCDPIDSSPPDSPVPGILQARVLEWGAIAFSTTTATGHLLCNSI